MVEAGEPITYSSILDEHDVFRAQRETRQAILKELSLPGYNNEDEPNSVIAHLATDPLGSEDIPILGNLLLKIGDVKTLNLILGSPGGDGTVVEKFVGLCRSQCKRFRVIIPSEAKSAATLIALGADEIVMGPPSEMGPIDAQIPVFASGIIKYISAQSFIDARDELVKKYNEYQKKGEDTGAIMQMLATLDLPFIVECERLMDFGRDVARKFLDKYMFKKVKDKKNKIDKVVGDLSSVQIHKVHGRMIDGRTARTEYHLKTLLMGNNDIFWQKVWEYYTRTIVLLGKSGAKKFFETEHELLLGVSRPD